MSTELGTMTGAGGYARTGGAPSDCGCGGDACGLERVRFFPRQILGAEDLNTEQRYFKEKQRRHNRFLHGWGVVCGCEVRPAATRDKPYRVAICPGYLVTPCGDEVMIGCPALFDLATCMVSSDDPCAFARPCPPVTPTTPMRTLLHLAVCYKECEVRPVRVAPGGCACDDAQCDYSRIRDAYEFCCLDTLPRSHVPWTCEELCAGGVLPCLPAPASDCVVLATIRIDGSGQDARVTIDNSSRQLLYSTAMLQMMAWCQCGQHGRLTVATPVIVPESDTAFEDPVLVDITTATPGATIYYTTDGSVPTVASHLYTGPVDLPLARFANNQKVTVLAIAVLAGYEDSAVASAVIHGNPNP